MTDVAREGKPSAISNSLRRLGNEIAIFEDFVSELKGTIKPPSGEEELGKPQPPSFNEVYQDLPPKLNQFCERLQKCREELKEVLI